MSHKEASESHSSSSYSTTLTTYETAQSKDDGSMEIITRTVTTAVTDPILHHVRFTGPDTEQQLEEYIENLRSQNEDYEEFETVDEEGNVTKTVIRRVKQVAGSEQPAGSVPFVSPIRHSDTAETFSSSGALGGAALSQSSDDVSPVTSSSSHSISQSAAVFGTASGPKTGVTGSLAAYPHQSASGSGGSTDSLASSTGSYTGAPPPSQQ